MIRRTPCRKRKQATVNVDADNFVAAQKRGYNLSNVVDIVLQHLLSSESDCIALDIRIAEYEGSIEKQNKVIEEHSRYVRNAEAIIIERQKILEQLYKDREESSSRLDYVKLITRLNSLIIASNYDVKVVSIVARDIIADILKHDEYFDLETHISTFKFI